MTELVYQKYARIPFEIDAVEITKENIDEVAQYIGELRQTDEGETYIWSDPRLVAGNARRVWPGFYMTRMDDRTRCYSGRTFLKQFELVNNE